MTKVIIFDFFDVIKSDPYNAWLRKRGLIREDQYLEASQALDSGTIDSTEFRSLLSGLSGESVESVNQEFDTVTEIDAEVVAVIDDLRNHYKTALLSNSPSAPLRGILKENDLEKHFDEIVISGEVGLVKPSREIFELIIERLGITVADALFIDDSKCHIAGAEKAGIKSIQFKSVHQLTADLRAAGINLK